MPQSIRLATGILDGPRPPAGGAPPARAWTPGTRSNPLASEDDRGCFIAVCAGGSSRDADIGRGVGDARRTEGLAAQPTTLKAPGEVQDRTPRGAFGFTHLEPTRADMLVSGFRPPRQTTC
jgi:hypothetical protein